jgi:AcrR family transcriptional regulator
MATGIKGRRSRGGTGGQARTRLARAAVVQAARALFLERGYAATTIEAISEASGVPPATVYRLFSSKLGILKELLDVSVAGDDQAVALADRPHVRALLADRDPRNQLSGFAGISCGILARAEPVYRILVSAAGSDADAAALLGEADRACDRVAILDQGRLVRIGSPVALKEEVGGGRLVLTVPDPAERERAADALAAAETVVRVQADGQPDGRLVVYVRDAPASVAPVIELLAAQRIRVASVEQAQASLDDVFLHFTGDRPQAEPRVRGSVSGMFAAAHGRRRH